jgi:hypothetical protein
MELASITPEQWRVVWGFVKSQLSGTPRPRITSNQSAFDTISFRNDSGEEIPAFAAMRVTGVAMLDDQIVVTVNKPNSSTFETLINGPQAVATTEIGSGYKYGILQAKVEAGRTLGETLKAKASSWELEDGTGPFIFLGYDTEYDCGLVRYAASAGGGSTLYRFETTAAYTTGTSVAATIKTMAGTTFASGATLKDPEAIFVGLASGAKGYCIAQGGEYFAIQALCAPEEGYV